MGTHPIFESDFDCLTEMAKGKKGKGKKGKKSKEKAPSFSHEHYQEQIRSQKTNLEQITDVYDEELLTYQDIHALSAQIETDKGDITSYVHRMIREKELDIELLNETEKSIIDKNKIESMGKELRENIEKHKFEKNERELQKLKLVGSLKEMSEISHDKRKIERQIEEHIKLHDAEKETFTEELYQSEKKSLQRRDGIKLEMVARVKQLTGDFHQLSAAQVSKISEGAIRKNLVLKESLSQSDRVAHESIARNRQFETTLNRVVLNSKAYENTNHESVATGTIAAFRRENAQRTKMLQDLVLEYRATEDKIHALRARSEDLVNIEEEMDEIESSAQVKHQEAAIASLLSQKDSLCSKCDAIEQKRIHTEFESDKLFELAKRVLRDLQNGGLTRLTTKLLLDLNSLELRSKVALDLNRHYTPGSLNIIP